MGLEAPEKTVEYSVYNWGYSERQILFDGKPREETEGYREYLAVQARDKKDGRHRWKGKKKPKAQIKDYSWASRRDHGKFLSKLSTINCFITVNPPDLMYDRSKNALERLEIFGRFIKPLIRLMGEKGLTGTLTREMELRRFGPNYGEVVPHCHIILCEPLSALDKQQLNEKITNLMKLPDEYSRDEAIKHAVQFDDLDPTDPEGINKAIGYMTKPIPKNVLKKLNGAPIGRSWFKIGKPKIERNPLILSAEGKEHYVFARSVKRAIAAKRRQCGKELEKKIYKNFENLKKRGIPITPERKARADRKVKRASRMSKSMWLNLHDCWSRISFYLPIDTILRLHNHACMEALGKDEKPLQTPDSWRWDRQMGKTKKAVGGKPLPMAA